jgi:hypothetical protein
MPRTSRPLDKPREWITAGSKLSSRMPGRRSARASVLSFENIGGENERDVELSKHQQRSHAGPW